MLYHTGEWWIGNDYSNAALPTILSSLYYLKKNLPASQARGIEGQNPPRSTWKQFASIPSYTVGPAKRLSDWWRLIDKVVQWRRSPAFMVCLHALPQSLHQQLWIAFQMSDDGVAPDCRVSEPTELVWIIRVRLWHVVFVEVDVARWNRSDGQRNHPGQIHLKTPTESLHWEIN